MPARVRDQATRVYSGRPKGNGIPAPTVLGGPGPVPDLGHVLQVLDRKKVLGGIPVERVVFNAVTKEAVLDAMRHPRAIDGPLVNAYLARRALDYLVGFTLAPVLWWKLPGARSAGRVQSVALRLVCDHRPDIEKFRTQEYWSILPELTTVKNETFQARLVAADGKKPEAAAAYQAALGKLDAAAKAGKGGAASSRADSVYRELIGQKLDAAGGGK